MFPDGQISDDLFVEKFVRPVFTSEDLFVRDDLSVPTNRSSSSVKTANDIRKETDLLETDLFPMSLCR